MLEIRPLVRFLVVVLSCLLACSGENKGAHSTQVLLVIDSDLDDLASVEVRVQDMAGESEGSAHTFTLSEDIKLPVSLTIVPSPGKTSSAFRVLARGLDRERALLVETQAYGRFVAGKRVALALWLRAACRGVTCGVGETCSAEPGEEGACVDIPAPGTRELPSGGGNEDVPVLTPPSDRTPSDGGSSEASDSGKSEAADAGADGAAGAPGDAAVVVPRAENVPTLGAFSTLQEARRKGEPGSAAGYSLFDDGFEVGEASCTGAGLCLTGSFAP